ncbi:alpha/beta fold hydrolase [Salinispira pacifica]|uniref:Beta-ketoadipate enol-lactone hydrolase n=1 Tax=Salinispira pacifica TaxID=1307761 RepID=V5WHR1_9SPIO|nr:alpha/beta hydrolase [Salinispira pacifica]AHC15348.1 Beta-ketoadipate enol-lactone hydrolase [Salinispira pacifica]
MENQALLKSRTITILGTPIRVRISGSSVKNPLPPLILIHGNTGSGRWFEKVLGKYPGLTLAPDLPNFGESGHIEEWSVPDYSRWLGFIADYFDCDSFILLGHSFGGAVAMDFATAHPERVDRLFLVDSSPVGGLVTPGEHYPVIEQYKTNRDLLAQALRAVVPTLKDETLFQKLVDDAAAMKPESFTGHADTLAKADYRDAASQYKGPVHVLYGEHDVLIDDQKAEETAKAFSATLDKIYGCGHSPMVELPDKFWNIVAGYLQI